MVLLHDKPSQLATIAAIWDLSGSISNVYGGVMTAGSTDDECSALLTWAPAFISAPSIFGTINSGAGTTTSPVVRFTGVTVSNAYITLGQTPLANTGACVGIVVVGEARL